MTSTLRTPNKHCSITSNLIRNQIVGIVVFFALVLTAAKTCTAQSSSPSPSASPNQIVSITPDGFKPKTLTIQQGDTVTFINAGQEDHWPASNIHPTHDIYPEFDPHQAIKPGESWQFQFDRPGDWYFHDHLHPTASGEIQVKANPSDPTVTTKKEKRSLFDRARILYRGIKLSLILWVNSFFYNGDSGLASKNITKTIAKNNTTELIADIKSYGPEKVVNKLFEESGKGSTFNCHTFAHQIGRLSYQIYKDDALTRNITLCHSGYIHGSVAAFINDKGTQNLTQKVANVCEKATSSFGRLTCYHGAGHGLMAYVSNDLPIAIQKCQEFKNSFKTGNCLVGVFMENQGSILGDSLSQHPTVWVNTTDPYFPCNKVDQSNEVQRPCYAIQPNWMLYLNNNDLQATVTTCDKLTTDTSKGACFFGYGQSVTQISKFDPTQIVANCLKVPSAKIGRSQCFLGAQAVLMDYWGPNMTDQGSKLCEAEPNEFKTNCQEVLSKRKKDLKLN